MKIFSKKVKKKRARRLSGRLANMRVYLAGPMDRCADGGVTWRANLTPFLKDLGLHVFDPTNKPISIGSEDMENRRLRRQWKVAGQFDKLSQEVRTISNLDLRMVDICDFIIVHLDLKLYPAGTIWEMVIANQQKKPILLHFEQGLTQIPDWFFGRLPHREFFGSWDALKTYLNKIAFDKKFDPGKRWYFFDKGSL